ncbi:MAG: right-handed parallel beta-helix repeat-containing protein [Planctomycetes bacterium]|nr:right-handed parallel beta-helix repeat-containing protein [Planctomycetota bacterium]
MFLNSLKQRSRSAGFLATVLALLSVPAVSQAKTVDEVLRDNPGVTYFAGSNKFYKFVNQRVSWSRARSLAESTKLEGVNGRLIESRSAAEQAFILNNTKNFCWLGGTDAGHEGRWVWLSDGRQFSNGGRAVNGMYTNWYPRKPDNYGGNEPCLFTFDKAYRGGKWDDLRPNPYGATVQYAVEWGAGAVGVPTNFFVRTSGNDSNDGLSKERAFRTIKKAASVAEAGSTIYVGAGSYRDKLEKFNSGTAAKPIRFIADITGARTGDSGKVTHSSKLKVEKKHYLQFQNFQFTKDEIEVKKANGIQFLQCDFFEHKEFELDESSVGIVRCVIRNGRDSGIEIEKGDVSLYNCLISHNKDNGIEIEDTDRRTRIHYCTFAYNGDDGLDMDKGAGFVTNCIFAFNKDDGLDGRSGVSHGNNVFFGNGSNDLEGTSRASSEIFADPKFVSSSDFHLQDGSPAIDKGSGNQAVDLEGKRRPVGAGFDIGCYEGGLGGGGGGGSSDEYFVRRSGNDSNDGRSKEKAFRTIVKATSVAGAGDTVYIGAGTYKESPNHRADGTSSKPIRFIGDKTGAKTGDAGTILVRGGVTVDGGDYTQLEGLKFTHSSTVVKWGNCSGGLLKGCDISGGGNGLETKNLTLTIDGCSFHNLRGDGAKFNELSTVTVKKSVFSKNGKDGLHLHKSRSVTIEDCNIVDNGDDGIRPHEVGQLVVRRCSILNNGDDGLDVEQTRALVADCLIASNGDDGVEWEKGAHMDLFHCTVVGNDDEGVGIYERGPTGTVRNNIIALNRSHGIENYGSVSHSYNLLYRNREGNYQNTRAGTGEINVDPRFVSGADFHLRNDSPAINKAVGTDSVLDLDSKKRPAGPRSEFGCYESGATGGPVDPPLRGDYYVRIKGSDRNNGKSPQKAFRTIARALRVVKAGEKVYVGAGNYKESLQRGNVRIPASKPVLMVADLSGAATGDKGAVTTASLYMWNTSHITWNGFTFSGARSYAVYGNNTNWTFRNCTFAGRATGLQQNRGAVKLVACKVTTKGTGVFGYSGATTNITDSTFNGCSKGIHQERATTSITGSSFSNSRTYGIYAKYATAAIKNVKVDKASKGIYLDNCTAAVDGVNISGTRDWAFQWHGKGTLSNSVVQDSQAGYHVGGSYRPGDIKFSNVKLKNITKEGLVLTRVDGDISGDGTQIAGGGYAALDLVLCNVNISNGTVRNARNAIRTNSGNYRFNNIKLLDFTEWGMLAKNSTASLTDCEIKNRSKRGSGLYFNASHPTLTNCTFANMGTALQAFGNPKVKVTNCQFANVTNGVYVDRGTMDLSKVTVTNSTSRAVYQKYGTATIDDLTASKGVKGVYLDSSNAKVANVSITGMTDWGFQWNGKGTLTNSVVQDSQAGYHVGGSYRPGDIKFSNVKLKNITKEGLVLTRVDGDISGDGTQIAGGGYAALDLVLCNVNISNGTVRNARNAIRTNSGNYRFNNIKLLDFTEWGMLAKNSTASLTDCEIKNRSKRGSGLYFNASHPTLTNCTFANMGTALQAFGNPKVAITNCQFTNVNNGVHADRGSINMRNSRIDNSSYVGIYNKYGVVNLSSVSMTKGRRGIHLEGSTLAIDKVSVSGMSDWGFGISGRGTVKNSTAQDSTYGMSLSGVYRPGDIKVSAIKIKNIEKKGISFYRVDGDATGEGTQISGEGVILYGCNVSLTNGTIRNPSRYNHGIYARESTVALSHLKIRDCTNYGIYSYRANVSLRKSEVKNGKNWAIAQVYGDLTVANSVVANNSSGIYSASPREAMIVNSTLVDNTYYGVYLTRGNLGVYNNIITSKSGRYGLTSVYPGMKHTHNLVSGFRTPFYRTAQHKTEITTAPKFRNASNGDYQHVKGSAAINSGKDLLLLLDTDLDGVKRPQTRVFDLGAHEFKGADGGFRILKWTEKE